MWRKAVLDTSVRPLGHWVLDSDPTDHTFIATIDPKPASAAAAPGSLVG